MPPSRQFSDIRFSRWAEKYSEHLAANPTTETYLPPDEISRYVNAYGMVRYIGWEVMERTEIRPFACTVNGQEVAWVNIINISDTCLYVRGLYTDPAHRKQGHASALLEFAIAQWPLPFTQVALYTYGDVYALYERLGFTRIIERTYMHENHATALRCYLMTKPINTAC